MMMCSLKNDRARLERQRAAIIGEMVHLSDVITASITKKGLFGGIDDNELLDAMISLQAMLSQRAEVLMAVDLSLLDDLDDDHGRLN